MAFSEIEQDIQEARWHGGWLKALARGIWDVLATVGVWFWELHGAVKAVILVVLLIVFGPAIPLVLKAAAIKERAGATFINQAGDRKASAQVNSAFNARALFRQVLLLVLFLGAVVAFAAVTAPA